METPSRKPDGNPARIYGLLAIILLVLCGFYYVASDRSAPWSARGIVSAHVIQIGPRVPGRVTDVAVRDNALVDAGAVLFSLDKVPMQIAVARAEAALADATQGVGAASTALSAAQAQVAMATANFDAVEAQTARVLELQSRGLVSDKGGEAARAQLETARAQRDAAQAQLESQRTQLGPETADNPRIRAARQALGQAQYDLLSADVLAPQRGVVTNLQLSPGQVLSAGSPVLTFISADEAWVTVDLRENQLGNIDPGDRAELLFDVAPGAIYSGTVNSIAWGINPGRAQAGGLVQNAPDTRWFEPARRIPVRVDLDGTLEDWPQNAKVGGKVTVVVYARDGGPAAWLAAGVIRIQSILSYLH